MESSPRKKNSLSTIPGAVEERLPSVTKLKERDSTSVLKFLSWLYELNLTAEDYFPLIFERLANLQGNKFLLKMVADTPDKNALTFQNVSRRILDTTPCKVRREYQKYLCRPQRPHESFRDFVKDISKYNSILQLHDQSELVEIILVGVKSHTRVHFQFQTVPTNMQELETLVCHVEKLEKNQASTIPW
ncbi:hypothetical protein GE061_004343 [Apolygus lucorum]|uniref:Uncharacterized protein n=1 Tax=Apolygus lucorum TaxID=248454 RepID=A0A6A4J4B7_APOLU|nr:hypothetical protein GE061_004343 [Apolygus lucorum]